jgi:hypothetical protein
MVKFFRTMPPMLEQYNPEDTFADYTSDYVTCDEDGYLQSYDDKPSSVVNIPSTDTRAMTWHSRNKVCREKESPHLNMSPSKFLTHDDNGLLHSFNGMPSKTKCGQSIVWLEWHNHGGLHRDAGLPAAICANKDKILESSYYEDGKLHRGDNQPADVSLQSSLWYVKGWQHNAKGYSEINKGSGTRLAPLYKAWHLYDIRLSEEKFNSVKAFETEKGVPLWVAFLWKLDFIHDDELSLFLNESGAWDGVFPINWVLKCWGITDEVFKAKVKELYVMEDRDFGSIAYLDALLEISEFEKSCEA